MKIKLILMVLAVVGIVQAAENKNLEFRGLGSIETALVNWNSNTNLNSTPIIYQGNYLFQETYNHFKNLNKVNKIFTSTNNCVLVCNNNNKMIKMGRVDTQMVDDLLQNKVELKNNDNSALDKDISKIVNKNNKNNLLQASGVQMEGRSVIFHINPFKNAAEKDAYYSEIKKLLGNEINPRHEKTKIFIVIDRECNVNEVKQLFLDKNIAFIFYPGKS